MTTSETSQIGAKRSARTDSRAEKQDSRIAPAGADLSWNFSKVSLFPVDSLNQPHDAPPHPPFSPRLVRRPRNLKAKLVVGSVRDPLELEADAVADKVMRKDGPTRETARTSDAASEVTPEVTHEAAREIANEIKVQRKCGSGCECQACRRDTDEEEPTFLARAESAQGADFDLTAAPDIVEDVLRSPGEAFDPAARSFFEARFRRDFRDVRIHADPRAAESARSVGALAYTAGRNIVFGRGQYQPGTSTGRRLLAHELAHVEQQRNGRAGAAEHISRQVGSDEDEEERKKREAEQRAQQPDAGTAAGSAATPNAGTGGAGVDAPPAPQPEVKPPADQLKQSEGAAPPAPKADVGKGAQTPAAAQDVTRGGHSAAPPDMAQCPDAPQRNVVVVGCTPTPAAAPPAVEKVELPTPNPAPFGGDADRAKFAKELAQCRAARVVKDTIESRYRDAVKAATTRATEEAKHDTEEALKTATEGIDPKEKSAIAKAKAQAAAEAKKAAAKKIADAKAAVKRQEVAAVTAELATAFEKALEDDFRKTIDSLMKNSGPGWVRTQQAERNDKRAKVTKEKNAKPKPVKGQEPPPPKSPEEISAAIEAEMSEFRCGQKQWVLDQIEIVSRAWAVGRREQVDFDTRAKGAYLKDFAPTYTPRPEDLVPLVDPKTQAKLFGVAPEMDDFLNRLRADPATPPFRAENRKDHGGGGWLNKGFSADLYLTSAPKDQRGFWRHGDAVNFLLRLDATAKGLKARWRVLYNDFRVADEVNTATGSRNVVFIGELDKSGKLNWHGPEGLILHFHLDLEIPKKVAAPAAPTP